MTYETKEYVRPLARVFINEGIRPIRAIRAAILFQRLTTAVEGLGQTPTDKDTVRQVALETNQLGVEITPQEATEYLELINELCS